jgi:hypothetical protein
MALQNLQRDHWQRQGCQGKGAKPRHPRESCLRLLWRAERDSRVRTQEQVQLFLFFLESKTTIILEGVSIFHQCFIKHNVVNTSAWLAAAPPGSDRRRGRAWTTRAAASGCPNTGYKRSPHISGNGVSYDKPGVSKREKKEEEEHITTHDGTAVNTTLSSFFSPLFFLAFFLLALRPAGDVKDFCAALAFSDGAVISPALVLGQPLLGLHVLEPQLRLGHMGPEINQGLLLLRVVALQRNQLRGQCLHLSSARRTKNKIKKEEEEEETDFVWEKSPFFPFFFLFFSFFCGCSSQDLVLELADLVLERL